MIMGNKHEVCQGSHGITDAKLLSNAKIGT